MRLQSCEMEMLKRRCLNGDVTPLFFSVIALALALLWLFEAY